MLDTYTTQIPSQVLNNIFLLFKGARAQTIGLKNTYLKILFR